MPDPNGVFLLKKIRQITAHGPIFRVVLSRVSALTYYFGGIMKTILCATLLLLTSTANASTMLLWSCKLLAGHTIDDVKAINSAWVDYVNELTDYRAQSYVLEAIASDDMTSFRYIDVFENPIHWGQIRSKMEAGDFDKFEAQFNNATQCDTASLYEAEES